MVFIKLTLYIIAFVPWWWGNWGKVKIELGMLGIILRRVSNHRSILLQS